MKRNPYRRLAEWLTRSLRLGKRNGKGEQLQQEIRALAFGEQDAVQKYYVGKIERLLVAVTILGVICIPGALLTRGGTRELPDGRVRRPDYGSGSIQEILEVSVGEGTEGIEGETVEVIVGSRQYTPEEAREQLEAALEELQGVILGNNPSEDEVRSDLIFPATLQEGRVKAEWLTIPYGILSEQGEILKAEEERGTVVEIRATLSCQGEQLLYWMAVKVLPPLLTQQESLRRELEQKIHQADEQSQTRAWLELPGEVSGKAVSWKMTSQGQSALFLLLLVFLPLFWYVRSDQKIHEQAKQRQDELALDYPQLMWKLTMLLGAGLTIHDAFFRIAEGYRKEREQGRRRRRYVYEEMCRTCSQIRQGEGEAAAYERFGQRCGLQGYIKLGTLLSQSLRKGSKGLGQTLEKEAAVSMEERRKVARKLGEQAGTKLLFPMMLMLGVVLMVLMVPAFLAL